MNKTRMSLYGLLTPITDHIYDFFLVEIRLSCAFGLLFFFRREWITPRLVIAISLIISLFILPQMNQTMDNKASFSELTLALLNQACMGLITAFLVNFFVEFFVGFGQIISMQAGLGFVNFFVPKVGQVSPLTHFFMLLSVTIFFTINGHLLLIKMLAQSIISLPALPTSFDRNILGQILDFSSIIYEGSVMLSLAVMFSVMLSNMTLAILTKFSPQLNLFSIGINISLLICFFIVYLSFDVIVNNGTLLFNELIRFIQALRL